MLLPALNKAKGSAHTIACKSNLRQTGLSLANDSGDFNGWTPGYKYAYQKNAPVVWLKSGHCDQSESRSFLKQPFSKCAQFFRRYRRTAALTRHTFCTPFPKTMLQDLCHQQIIWSEFHLLFRKLNLKCRSTSMNYSDCCIAIWSPFLMMAETEQAFCPAWKRLSRTDISLFLSSV